MVLVLHLAEELPETWDLAKLVDKAIAVKFDGNGEQLKAQVLTCCSDVAWIRSHT